MSLFGYDLTMGSGILRVVKLLVANCVLRVASCELRGASNGKLTSCSLSIQSISRVKWINPFRKLLIRKRYILSLEK